MAMIKLIDIASARSGDKNNVCNIGVMANFSSLLLRLEIEIN